MVGSLFWALVRDPALGQRCAFVRAFTGVVSAAPDRQAGAALGPTTTGPRGAPPRRTGSRGGVPIRAFDSGRIGRAACSGAGSPRVKIDVGSTQCTTKERRTVLSIIRTEGIDLDALDAVAPSHNSLWAASQTAWAAGDPAP